ncbi:hypothetical protein [Microbacterium sp. MYb62]|uniref:hypothetical protein n=1 Tax=Microbacterium sp. MYb62 TaxID=1848690 RepID=UPI000CFD0A07|nr:hypothetical protein [Microbacterium sp. MYb62]PRB14482.1 hypothetical protein CQ042_11220 [Microbacterium sp. MYb62]
MAIHSEGINPTGDEREALLRDLYTLRGWSGGDVARRIEIIDRAMAALGHPEVPEPSADWDRVHDRPADVYTPPEDRVARPEPQGEPSDAGVGWFEWFKMPENTTEIAYVHESGEVFDPVRGWNPVEFTIAAAEGRVHRLVRAGGVR